MFKRPHLRAAKRLVNASSALALLFLATACSRGPEPAATDTVPDVMQPVEQAEDGGLVLPAVWQTDDLGTPIRSIAVAGQLGSTVAVAFNDGGLQFLNFEGERVTDKSDMGVAAVADGRFTLLQGTPVTVFPGITTVGELSLFIHGGDLIEPIPYPLDPGVDGAIEGICSAAPSVESDGVLRLGFWTVAERRTLQSGRIVEVGDSLILLLDEPVQADRDISACLLTETGANVYSRPAIAAAEVNYRSKAYTFVLDSAGGYTLSNAGGEQTSFIVRDGITVQPPAFPVDMAGTGDARGGGYPGGLLVVGGETPRGDHSVTFIDPSEVTLQPFGYSPSAPGE